MKAQTILVDVWGAVTSHVAITEWLIGLPKWAALVLGLALTSIVGGVIAQLLRKQNGEEFHASEPTSDQPVRRRYETATSDGRANGRSPKPVRIGISTTSDGSVEVTIVTNDPANSGHGRASSPLQPKSKKIQLKQPERK